MPNATTKIGVNNANCHHQGRSQQCQLIGLNKDTTKVGSNAMQPPSVGKVVGNAMQPPSVGKVVGLNNAKCNHKGKSGRSQQCQASHH